MARHTALSADLGDLAEDYVHLALHLHNPATATLSRLKQIITRKIGWDS